MSDNMERYNRMSRPPARALKTIPAGRLKGMTDIKPQWRIEVMTENYGECGVGWYHEIVNLWTEKGANEEVTAHAQVNIYIRNGAEWSKPISGIGGAMLIAKEKGGLYTSDEAYKMAVTDAISVALKYLGVGADIYNGLWDGSKYNTSRDAEPKKANLHGGETLKNEDTYNEYVFKCKDMIDVAKSKKELIDIFNSEAFQGLKEELKKHSEKHFNEIGAFYKAKENELAKRAA